MESDKNKAVSSQHLAVGAAPCDVTGGTNTSLRFVHTFRKVESSLLLGNVGKMDFAKHGEIKSQNIKYKYIKTVFNKVSLQVNKLIYDHSDRKAF